MESKLKMTKGTCVVLCVLLVVLLTGERVDAAAEATNSSVEVLNSNKSRALIHFQNANVRNEYKSSDHFDPKGMEHLYTITNLFLDFIQPKDFPADIFTNSTEDVTVVLLDKKEELLQYYIGLVIVALVGLLLALLLPIIGFIFCLCRCAGRCGARTEPYEKRYDSCKRHFLGTILTGLVVLLMFGIVCGFVTNEYIEQGIDQLPSKLNGSLDDVDLYMKNTKIEINTLLKTNFDELRTALNEILDSSGETVKTRLAETSKASAIENLTTIVEGLDKVHDDLENITRSTQSLLFQVRQLDESLKDIRNRITLMVAQCRDLICDEIRRYAASNNLTVTASLYQLPDVTDIAHRISDFIEKGVEAEVRKGKDSLDKISVLVQQAVDRTVPEIKSKLVRVGQELAENSDNLCRTIDKVELQRGRKAVNYVKQYSDEYGSLRHYVGLGLCCVVLLITICLVCGLFCGFCGHKPHPYGNDTCSRVTGANFLMAAVYLIFLLSVFLLAVITVLFLAGGVTERVVCDPIQDPDNASVFELVETFFPIVVYPDERSAHVPLSDIVKKCHQNLSIYKVLHLENIFNITEAKHYKERYKLDEQVDELRQQIALNPAVLILTEQARRQLHELAESEFAKLDFDTFMKRLDLPVTPIDLNEVMQKLDEVVLHVRSDIAYNLKRERETLGYLQREVISNITATMIKIKKYLTALQTNILFNKTTFRDVIYELLNQAEQAQKFIQTQGRTEVMNLADEFTENFTRLLDEYAKHIEVNVQTKIGQCSPMSKAFNASVVGVCKNIVNPFNGFWASIGWCILLFLPSIIFAVLLSSSYRKTDPYTGPLVESAHKKRRTRTSETYDNRNGYVPDYMLGAGEDAARFRREAYPQPSSHGSRYSRVDVDPYKPSAPSAWTPDYSSSSNLGSPDYERPPPYYFPGPVPENNG